eukprot:3415425-Amphidinium_carterae.1
MDIVSDALSHHRSEQYQNSGPFCSTPFLCVHKHRALLLGIGWSKQSRGQPGQSNNALVRLW